VSTPINVLLIGGGGREHAIAHKPSRSRCDSARCTPRTPGNPGHRQRSLTPVDVPVSIARAVPAPAATASTRDVGLVVIGPEDPLAEGWADKLASTRLRRRVFGPDQSHRPRLEADKAYAKQIMRGGLHCPTADGPGIFDRSEFAKEYLRNPRRSSRSSRPPGSPRARASSSPTPRRKGSRSSRPDHGRARLRRRRLDRRHRRDGSPAPRSRCSPSSTAGTCSSLPPCQDHKRLLDGGIGPNTGGMGAFCPAPVTDDDMLERIEREVLVPTVDALRREDDRVPRRALRRAHAHTRRPEGPRVQRPLRRPRVPAAHAAPRHRPHRAHPRDLPRHARPSRRPTGPTTALRCVVLAAHNYPETPRTGDVITGARRRRRDRRASPSTTPEPR
jgi:phosphoribosylamine--glycine ligase